jgi:hypothetical protein
VANTFRSATDVDHHIDQQEDCRESMSTNGLGQTNRDEHAPATNHVVDQPRDNDVQEEEEEEEEEEEDHV